MVGAEFALDAFEPLDLGIDLLDVKVEVRLGGGLEVAVDALSVLRQPGVGRGDVRALLAFVGHVSRILRSRAFQN